MVKKILFCATVDYHFKAFHLPYMDWFQKQGWEVHVAAAGDMELPCTNKKYNIAIQRSPFHPSNIKAFEQLKEIIDDNNYSIIHCHTPLGGVLARLAARQTRKMGTSVIYTAHGFHFCKGAPLKNWLMYYPMERYLSKHTDTLITINSEDYNLARRHQFQSDSIEHVHGVGVNTNKFKPIDEENKRELRKSFGYQSDDFLLFYAAEFNKNKNQQFLLQVLALIKNKVPNVKLLLAGEGPSLQNCMTLANHLGIDDRVDLLGLRHDIHQLVPMCDVGVASSLREGLPVNVMEMMASGLPIVAVDNRGHRELITNNKNGWLISRLDPIDFAEKVINLAKFSDIRKQFGKNARDSILSTYSLEKVLKEKKTIYQSLMDREEGIEWAIH
ncbi:glycosyltransferase family 4 protein [Oceanobacillus halophilus]|uniref:glycosyltransferase family 4 protein n=1 Tax=Oceanobacillus halophilus TaxID=930130 RepID=UPI001F4D94DD|nr:glycosyltransferase family 4 protein [Oceanobacillus halophilus]